MERINLLFLLFILPLQAFAYVPTLTNAGIQISWKPPVKLQFLGNTENNSGLNPNQIWDSVVTSLQRWKEASQGTVNFDYWQGTSPKVYPRNSEMNHISSIYFISHSDPPTEMPANVLGLTQVWYNVETGEILETDISLNDRNFNFTNNPRDTTGYGGEKTQASGGKLNVYLQNVLSHELGHALGLSHSAILQSTLLFMESPEQAHLSCDEQVAIQALYPNAQSPKVGSLTGTVLDPSGAPFLGAHIQAISQPRGTVLAGGLTDLKGKFKIDGLEPGTYYLMVEPYYAGIQALPSYYSQMNQSTCGPDQKFERRFLVIPDQPKQLQPFEVVEDQLTNVPDLKLECNTSAVRTNLLPRPAVTAISNSHFGFMDEISPTYKNSYKLPPLSGHLEIHALAYSLYSPLHISIELKSDQLVEAQLYDPVYTGDSGYKNYDTYLVADDLPQGNYSIQIHAETLSVNNYPAGPLALDTRPFLIITGNLTKHSPASSLPNNVRCRTEEKYPTYSSPSQSPPSPDNPKDGGGSTGFCAFQSDRKNQRSSSWYEILGWLTPWLVIFLLRIRPTANLKRWALNRVDRWQVHF